MHEYYDIKDMLCKELKDIARAGELSSGSLDAVHKITSSIKDIETIIAMEEYGDESSYDDRRMMRGNSNARKRDRMGRYSRDDEIADTIHEYMRTIDDPRKKAEAKRFLESMEM